MAKQKAAPILVLLLGAASYSILLAKLGGLFVNGTSRQITELHDLVHYEKDVKRDVIGNSGKATSSYMPNRFFSAPWNHTKLFLGLYPELRNATEIHLNGDDYMNFTYASNDFFVMGKHGPLQGVFTEAWLDGHFPGTALFFNHEYYHFVYGERPKKHVPTYQRIFYFGSYKDSNRTMQLHPIRSLMAREDLDTQQQLYDPSRKPVNTQERFVIYVAGHCVEYRTKVFQALSTIDTVYYGGTCNGFELNNDMKRDPSFKNLVWQENYKFFGRYKFCLVFENRKMNGYITEKILNAWKGGCVPIYYGTRDVFKLFNHKAFVYYDVKDARPAFERIKYLHHNQTAYNEVLAEPILADGNRTIEEYFSLSDKVGGGKLKNRIRTFIDAVRREYVGE